MTFNEPNLWQTLERYYYLQNEDLVKPPGPYVGNMESKIECKIAGFYEKSNGKWSEDQAQGPQDQIVIEVKNYLKLFATGIPQVLNNIMPGFGEWVESRSLEFVQMMMMTLPSPRHNFYQSSNYDEIQLGVLTESN